MKNLGGVGERRGDVRGGELRILVEDLLDGASVSQAANDQADRDSRPAYAGLAVVQLGIDDDSLV